MVLGFQVLHGLYCEYLDSVNGPYQLGTSSTRIREYSKLYEFNCEKSGIVPLEFCPSTMVIVVMSS